MKESLKWQLLFVFLLVGIAVYFAYPSEDKPLFRKGEMFEGHKIQLGLDLQGGSELILGFKDEAKIQQAEIKSGIESARNTIERRINNLGLKEPRIQSYGENQLQIQLPGLEAGEIDRIKDVITTSGKLEFKLEASQSYKKAYEGRRPLAPTGYQWYEYTDEQRKSVEWLLVEAVPVVSGTNITNAGYEFTMEHGTVVTLKLDTMGTYIFDDVTGKHHKTSGDSRRLVIVLDGQVVSAPEISTRISGGGAIITSGRLGGFSEPEARDLSMILRSGSLPAPLEIRSENTVGPSLGSDAIHRGIIAFILAMVVVALFMLIYYRGLGLISVIALAMNAALLLGILAYFNATLTFPGIAGIILTMGMALDSNVIFYERIREEQEKGKTLNLAFEGGFGKALVTVVDANITTLIAGLILWYFGTGAVRGFAITLSAGILTTLFTGYFATKLMTQFSLESGLIKKFAMFRMLAKPNYDYIGKSRYFIYGSVAVILVGLVIFFNQGIKTNKCYGVDFTGGTVLNIHFKEPVNITEMRTAVQNITTTNQAGLTVPKYPDVEVQSVLPPVTGTQMAEIKSILSQAAQSSNEFQIRTRYVQTQEGVLALKGELRNLFKDKLAPEPLPVADLIPANDPLYTRGYRLKMVLNSENPMEKENLKTRLEEIARKNGKENPDVFIPEGISGTNSTRFEIYFKEIDSTLWERILRSPEGLNLPRGDFPLASIVGSMMSRNLQQNAIIAIILSWVSMLIYIAIRFELKYGLAALVALIHDVLVALGVTVAFNWLVPDTWGIGVDINFSSVAAFMTIIGYSVNDTIVVFDRVRENLKEMKRASFGEILNASVNQTLSRTIITAITVFFSVTILFIVTARSGGGIASFAFPLVIGTIAGCYSTIFIASPFVKMWKGKE